MDKFIEFTTKIQNNKYLQLITGSLITLTPLFIVGALFSLLNNLPISVVQNFLVSANLKVILSIPTNLTTNLSALYVAFLIGYKAAEIDNRKDGIYVGLISMVSFLILTPFTSGESFELLSLDTQWFGAAGMMTAFITSLIVSQLALYFYKKELTIKMPAGVPSNVSQSFTALIPATIVFILMLMVRYGFLLTPFDNIHTFIYGTISLPLKNLGGSLPAFIIYVILIHVFWFFGLHGTLVLGSIIAPILIPLGMENLAATNAGLTPPNILTLTFLFQSIGASAGNTLGLSFAMLRSKSERYRTLGKLSIVPNIFCINEPLIFGFPIVMNFRLLIPFILSPIISFVLAYTLTILNILPKVNGISVPAGVPIIFAGIMGGGWQWGIFQFFIIILSYLIYLPFFKVIDRDELKLEVSNQ